jgi:hypothetical protein
MSFLLVSAANHRASTASDLVGRVALLLARFLKFIKKKKAGGGRSNA